MLIASYSISTYRHTAVGAPVGVPGGKRIASIGLGGMCMRTYIGRIQGCRPGSAARPGEQRG